MRKFDPSKKYGKLKPIRIIGRGGTNNIWLCECDCGNTHEIRQNNLMSLKNPKCKKCISELHSGIRRKHGMRKTRIYAEWIRMKQRCSEKNDEKFKYYAEKGIEVCKEWKNDFMNFYNWSMENGYDDTLTLDRIDFNGNYCPENCRWVDAITQANNKSTNHFCFYNGKRYTISQLSKAFNINKNTLKNRIINLKWDVKRAIEEPIDKRKGNVRCQAT